MPSPITKAEFEWWVNEFLNSETDLPAYKFMRLSQSQYEDFLRNRDMPHLRPNFKNPENKNG